MLLTATPPLPCAPANMCVISEELPCRGEGQGRGINPVSASDRGNLALIGPRNQQWPESLAGCHPLPRPGVEHPSTPHCHPVQDKGPVLPLAPAQTFCLGWGPLVTLAQPTEWAVGGGWSEKTRISLVPEALVKGGFVERLRLGGPEAGLGKEMAVRLSMSWLCPLSLGNLLWQRS